MLDILVSTLADNSHYLKIGVVVLASIEFYYLRNLYVGSGWTEELGKKLDRHRLKYLRRITISGYKTLSSEKIINDSITQVRELEKELGEKPKDFSKYKSEYQKQLHEASQRKSI